MGENGIEMRKRCHCCWWRNHFSMQQESMRSQALEVTEFCLWNVRWNLQGLQSRLGGRKKGTDSMLRCTLFFEWVQFWEVWCLGNRLLWFRRFLQICARQAGRLFSLPCWFTSPNCRTFFYAASQHRLIDTWHYFTSPSGTSSAWGSGQTTSPVIFWSRSGRPSRRPQEMQTWSNLFFLLDFAC